MRDHARTAPGVAFVALVASLTWTACASLDPPPPVETARILLLGTTDVHGHLLPWNYATDQPEDGSLAQAATLIDSLRATNDGVLLFDSGDLLQGTALNTRQAYLGEGEGHPAVAAMNELHYSAAVPGNHEFNYGLDFMHSALGGAQFPFLAANLYHAHSDSLVFPPFAVLEAAGLRVGIIGFTNPGIALWDRGNVEGRVRLADIVESAQRWMPQLLDRSPDIIVALAHSGLGPGSSYSASTGVPEENAVVRLAQTVPEIDVIFSGHSHLRIEGEEVGNAVIMQAGRFAQNVAAVQVGLTRSGGKWSIETRRAFLLPTAGAAVHPAVESLVTEAHTATREWVLEPIGSTPERWSAASARFEDSPILDLINAVQLEFTGADLASTASFNPKAGFGPGPISRRDILGLYVYPNTLKAVRVTGEDLRAYLEWSARYYHSWPTRQLVNDSVPGFNFDVISGLDYELDLTRPVGQRVASLSRDGRELGAGDTLTLAVNSYRQSGGGGATTIAGAPVVFSAEETIADLIVEFVERRGVLRSADIYQRNWSIGPVEAVERLKESNAAADVH
ncbi:MAG: 5'-nucleotidase C-terminal domain-containing protein [Gemmatimonadota bacterium]